MTNTTEPGQLRGSVRAEDERASVLSDNSRLRSDLEETQRALHTARGALNAVRTAIKRMGWRKCKVPGDAREAHNACLVELMDILDGKPGSADRCGRAAP